MRARDLMIGDWVKSRGKTEQVREVYDGFICTDSFEDSHDYHFEPIQLGIDVFSINGFDQMRLLLFVDHKNNVELKRVEPFQNMFKGPSLYHWELYFNGNYVCDICYMHELQHAYKLFNIEKEFNVW